MERKHCISRFHPPGRAPGRWSRRSGLRVHSFPPYPAEPLLRRARRPHRARACPLPGYIRAEPALRTPGACVGVSVPRSSVWVLVGPKSSARGPVAQQPSPGLPRPTHPSCFQVYDDGDYRKVRFVGRQKEVNENFAIDLIAEQPVSQVGSRVISCDGGGGALGHPRVYINLDKETKTGTCGYCGLQFRQQHH
nr:PREDICTED: NADH dehydrogenase [ubiquinone] iron-sulfur protein 6, mitochondrial [Bos mutus]